MATVTLADMESKLLTLDQVTRALEKTEPLSIDRIDGESTIRFSFDPDWNHGIESLASTEQVQASMTINGVERQLTKEAALQAGANFGLTSAYVRKIPAQFTQGLLNYHYGQGMGTNAYSVLSVGDNVSAFTRPTVVPYSNLQLLEKTVQGIQDRHGSDTPIFADYKMANSLQRTDVRLIIPAGERVMTDTGMDDIPSGSVDTWLSGIHLSNSMIGKDQTKLESYMFRYWCTNGATTQLEGVGTWSRRSNGSEDVYEWARETVDEILGGMEHMFDQVQALTSLNVNGATAEVLREIFAQYEVPVSQREAIMTRLLGMENITMYTIMQAITQAANEAELEDRRRDRLMRIGGALPSTQFDTLKARIFREGQQNPDAPNPYEPFAVLV